jgi:two-component system sensor histidine kinase KdpD
VATAISDVIERVMLAFPDPRIKVHVPEGLPAVSADPMLLERMVANLVSNALRYSPSDTDIEVTAHHDSRTVVLQVSDRGPGIPAAHSAEVFRPFHRIGAQPDGGTGLGLAIVKGFADAMGIDVDLRTGTAGGLDARLVIPRWQKRAGTP